MQSERTLNERMGVRGGLSRRYQDSVTSKQKKCRRTGGATYVSRVSALVNEEASNSKRERTWFPESGSQEEEGSEFFQALTKRSTRWSLPRKEGGETQDLPRWRSEIKKVIGVLRLLSGKPSRAGKKISDRRVGRPLSKVHVIYTEPFWAMSGRMAAK